MERVEPSPTRAEDCQFIGDTFVDPKIQKEFPIFWGTLEYRGSVIINADTKDYCHMFSEIPFLVLKLHNCCLEGKLATTDEELLRSLNLFKEYVIGRSK